jgi:hypothetical protein
MQSDSPPQFSEAQNHSRGLLAISPNGQLLAVVVQRRLFLRDFESQSVVQEYVHDDDVSHVEWSCDSRYILTVLARKKLVHVWAVEDKEWYCKIDEGPLGVVTARWAPDGRHVLTTSDFGMRVTVWSLLNRSVCYIRSPKLVEGGLEFSADGRWLAVAERSHGADAIGIYDTASWEQTAHFPVSTTDLARLRWAPSAARLGEPTGEGAALNERADTSSADWLFVTDGPLKLGVLVYRRDGRLISKYAPAAEPETTLGARVSGWAPSGRLLCVGSYAGMALVLTARTGHVIAQLEHPTTLRATHADGGDGGGSPLVFREVLLSDSEGARRAHEPADRLATIAESLPHVPTLTRPTRFEPVRLSAERLALAARSPAAEREAAMPTIGVDILACSPDGRYLATHAEGVPTALWVWEAATLRCATRALRLRADLSAPAPARALRACARGHARACACSHDAARPATLALGRTGCTRW